MIEPTVKDFEWREIAANLLRAQGISDGLWRFAVHVRMTAATIEWPAQSPQQLGATFPTAMVAFSGLQMTRVQTTGPMVFDAAELMSPGAAERHRKLDKPKGRATKIAKTATKPPSKQGRSPARGHGS